MSDKSDFIELAALWKSETKAGKKYLSGRLGNAKVFVFFDTDKQNPKAPDARIFVTPCNENRNAQGNNGGQRPSESMPRGQYERKAQSQNRQNPSGGYNSGGDDIPF